MKISIIVPVYKAEAYLHKCLDSLRSQTLKDFEIILVDDGSPDSSGKLCDEYASWDSRIQVIHRQNGGVSVARQTGLDAAHGEYVIHADPDDWAEPTMLEELYAKAKEADADMVICDFYTNEGSSQQYRKQQPSSLNHLTVMSEMFQYIHGSCCNKLIKRSCLKRFDIRFTSWLSFCEDLAFNTYLLKFDIKIAYLPKAFYHYTQNVNNNSIVKNITQDTLSYDLKVYHFLDELTKGFPAHTYFEQNFSRTCTIRAFRSGLLSNNEFKLKYGKFANYVWNHKSLSPNNILLYLSCKGLYRWCFILNRFIGKI